MRACLVLVVCAAVVGAGGLSHAERRTLKADPDQEYHVYAPDAIDPQKTYWLVVAVHGEHATGYSALGWKDFPRTADCIVLAPTFRGPFRFPDRGADKTLFAIVDELKKAYKLHPRMFVTGFDEGAEFAHRFALENAGRVIACAAHSAGAWDEPRGRARTVPFLVTCGEDDRTRIEAARTFANELREKGGIVETRWFPGVGHALCDEARAASEALFWKATTGLTPEERRQTESELGRAGDLVILQNYREAVEIFRKIAELKPKSTLTERAEAGLKQVEEIGRKKLAEVEELSRKDVQKALPALVELRRQFKDTDAAVSIARFLTRLKKRPEAAAEVQRMEDADEAEDLYMRAEKCLERKDVDRAVELLKGAARFAETEYGKKAAARLKELGSAPEAAPKTEAAPSDKDCARWLQMARNYVAAGKPEEARPLLQKIVEEHPDAPEAKEAKKLLAGL